jgi:superfamily II DNA helicase RecQ
LSELRNKFPGIPIMALTATANEECKADIIARLNIPDCVKLLLSFNRPNLHYVVKKRPPNFMQEIANAIKSTYHGESGIIYATARAKCEDFAKELREQYSVKARHYHAGMTSEDKQRTVEAWFSGQCQVVVATVCTF